MNEAVVDDLKQFISVAISQQTVELREDIVRLDAKIDGVSAGVAEILDELQTHYDSQLTDHEVRITRLESKSS